MKWNTYQVGAVFYILWGLLHIVGGGSLLWQVVGEGGPVAMATLGSALPASDIPSSTVPLLDATIGFHAWNLLWIGALAVGVGATLNWRNSWAGYWINMVLVGGADLGLIVGLLLPGYMLWTDGIWGPALWIVAAVFATLGLYGPVASPSHRPQATASHS